jgi:hypothetical protein
MHGFEELVDHILAGQPRRIPKLAGLLDGTPFVMLDGTLRLVNSPASGPPLVEVSAEAVLVGMPDGTEPTTFDRMVVTTHWLTELASVGGLRSQLAWPEGRPEDMRYSASTEPVDEVQGTILHADGHVITTLRVHPSQTSGRRMITLAEEADLELRFPRRFRWLDSVRSGCLPSRISSLSQRAAATWQTRYG